MAQRKVFLSVLPVAVALLIAAPVVAMVFTALQPGDPDVWRHLTDTVLTRYVMGSLVLSAGTVVLCGCTGTGCAWLVTHYRFPGSRVFQWALLLPMAVPAYVLAYCWTDLLEYAGPVQTGLRNLFGWSRGDYVFPNIRSLPGAVLVMSLVLYPYVFLFARASFLEQGATCYETARSLGWRPIRCFLRLAVPLARPGLVAGCALVAMETLADYGTVDYFGVQTFTTGITRTWHGFGSYVSAVRLALLLLAVVFALLLAERAGRGGKRYNRIGGRQAAPSPCRLTGANAGWAAAACAAPLLLGFGVPVLLLGKYCLNHATREAWWALRIEAATSLRLGLITAGLAVLLGLLLAYALRLSTGKGTRIATRIAAMGYAVPGSVVAVAVVVPLAWMDNTWIDPVWGTGLLLSGSGFALVYAYVVRFLAVALSGAESGLATISPQLEQASRGLGAGPRATLLRVHVPLAGASVLTGGLLVFIDVLKELPASLLLRPASGATLAVRVHQFVSQESLHLAALPALAIVVTGLLPVLLLTKGIRASTLKA